MTKNHFTSANHNVGPKNEVISIAFTSTSCNMNRNQYDESDELIKCISRANDENLFDVSLFTVLNHDQNLFNVSHRPNHVL